MAKFGVGQPVRRVEDRRFITGTGRYTDDIDLEGQVHGCVVRSPEAHARIKTLDIDAAKAADGVLAVITGADIEATGRQLPAVRHTDGEPGRLQGQEQAAPGAVHRAGPPCRRQRRLRGGRDPEPGQGRRRAGRRGLRVPGRGRRYRERGRPRPAAGPRRRPEQSELRLGVRRPRRGRGGLRQGSPRHQAPGDQQPPGRERDRAARGDRRLRCRSGHDHAAHLHPGRLAAHRHPGGGAQDRPVQGADPDPRRRRRLRDEGVLLSGIRHGGLGVPAARPAGEVDRRAQRDLSLRRSGPRSRHRGGARSRRRSQNPRHAGRDHRQHGRLQLAVRAVHPDRGGAQGPARRLRRQEPGLPGQRRAHQHHAGRCLPRRRPARIDLSDGAADGRRGARGRPGSGGVPPQELHPVRGHAVQDGGRRDLRFGRVRPGHGHRARTGRLDRASPGARRRASAAGCAAASACRTTSNRPWAIPRRRPRSASRRTAR